MRQIIATIIIVLGLQTAFTQWNQVTSPTTSSIYSVYFINSNTGFIAGNTSGVVIKTTNGGQSWIFIQTPASAGNVFQDMVFLDANTGFISGGNVQPILKTTNGGSNWNIVLSTSATLYSLSFPTPYIGYAAGSGTSSSYPSLWKTTDGGNTWINFTAPSTTPLRSAWFITSGYGWVCGYNGVIIKTTDGCISWIPQNISTSVNLEKVLMLNANSGFVIGSGGTILYTTNGGTNWMYQSSGLSDILYDMHFYGPSSLYIGTNSGKILKTTDLGQTWGRQTTPSTVYSINSIEVIDGMLAYAAGNTGTLWKTTNGGGPLILPLFTKLVQGPIGTDGEPSHGSSWCDYDNDGDQDLIVTYFNDNNWNTNYPIFLYRNDSTLGFTKITNSTISNELIKGASPIWGDYDNDGKTDLFISVLFGGNNLLFHNNGNGNFTKITSGPVVTDGGHSQSAAWLDYNRDGWLDLFVVNMYSENDFLYKNNGNGTFTKILNSPVVQDGSWGRGCTIGDYNNDGWSDLVVIGYQGIADRLYQNNNGTFSLTNGVLPYDNKWGSGATFGDYDNDGWLDLFVTNNNATNVLYHNNNGTSFSIANGPPSNDGTANTYGCNWFDYDNDGLIDLLATNFGSPSYLYKNSGNGNFQKITTESITNEVNYIASSVTADFNKDGKIDIFAANGGPDVPYRNDVLYKNTVTNPGNYIVIRLKGCTLNKSGIGSRIAVYTGNKRQIREVGGYSYISQDMLWQHFGLGNSTIVDSIIVKWTTGNTQKLYGIAINQYYLVDECLVGISNISNEVPKEHKLEQNYPNPFNPETNIRFQIPKGENVKLNIFTIDGKIIKTVLNEYKNPGYYEYKVDMTNFSSGIYLYEINTDSFNAVKKMILIK